MPESCWRNFLTRTSLVQHSTVFCGRLRLQGLQTGSPAAAENERSAQETCKCMCKWRPLWAQTVTDAIVYELLRRLFHIGNFCFWVPFFKQLLLKNCAVDFVEICNVCTRKATIEAAKRIFNSDKICRSCCDFYFGVTFLYHSVERVHNKLDAVLAVYGIILSRTKHSWMSISYLFCSFGAFVFAEFIPRCLIPRSA